MTFVMISLNPMHFCQHVAHFRVSVFDSKDVLGRPPETHSYPCPEGLQNVQEGMHDLVGT